MLNRALKLLRTYHGLRQLELASRLGISNSYLSEIEAGVKTASLELLQKYSDIFNMPVSSIMLFSEKIDNPASPSQRMKVAATKKILKLLEWIEDHEAK